MALRGYRFGPFELLIESGELRRRGTAIRLSPQPFRVLAILAERSGEVVSREEIRELLWGREEISVEFDTGMNRCIRQIRAALSDNADQPRYIETLARRGYRFIAPVEKLQDAAEEKPEIVAAAPAKRTRWRYALVSLVVVALAAMATALLLKPKGFPLPAGWNVAPLAVELGDQCCPTFSPDGRRVAFAWNGATRDRFEIYEKAVGSTGPPLRLTRSSEVAYGPAWSPDGKWIAFSRGSETPGGAVWIVPAGGGLERKVIDLETVAAPWNRTLAWMPDSKSLVVAEPVAGQTGKGLSIVDSETGFAKRITEPSADQFDMFPSVSPDGRLIAFTRDTGRGVSSIVLLPYPNGKPQPLHALGGEIFQSVFVGRSSWTPDGRYLVFESNAGGQQRLWLSPADRGDAPLDLAALGDSAQDAAISATGELAFGRQSFDPNIWKVEFSHFPDKFTLGAAPVIASTRLDDSPALSPDGKRIAFASNRSGWGEIWVSEANGSNARPVTSLKNPGTGSPDWSPDGLTLVFDSRVEGKPQIYTVTADGGKPRRFSRGEAIDVVPRYSPDGNWIYYSSDQTGFMEIWRAPVAGGTPERVTHHGGFAPVVSKDGKYLYFASNNEALAPLMQMTVAGGAEISVASLVSRRAYAAAPGGVVYFAGSNVNPRRSMFFYDAASEKTVSILETAKRVAAGMAISADARSLFFTQVDQEGRELLLVNDFWKR